MKRALFLSIIFLLALVSVGAAQDVTISFSDLTPSNSKLEVYYAKNMSLLGIYNTTDTLTLDPNESYVFVLKPNRINFLENPETALDLFMDWLPFSFSFLAVLFVLACIFALVWRVFS